MGTKGKFKEFWYLNLLLLNASSGSIFEKPLLCNLFCVPSWRPQPSLVVSFQSSPSQALSDQHKVTFTRSTFTWSKYSVHGGGQQEEDWGEWGTRGFEGGPRPIVHGVWYLGVAQLMFFEWTKEILALLLHQLCWARQVPSPLWGLMSLSVKMEIIITLSFS